MEGSAGEEQDTRGETEVVWRSLKRFGLMC